MFHARKYALTLTTFVMLAIGAGPASAESAPNAEELRNPIALPNPMTDNTVDVFFAGGQSNAHFFWKSGVQAALLNSGAYDNVEVVGKDRPGQPMECWIAECVRQDPVTPDEPSLCPGPCYKMDFFDDSDPNRETGVLAAEIVRIRAEYPPGATIRFSGLFWFQGESDAGIVEAALYKDRFKELLRRLEGDLLGIRVAIDESAIRFVVAIIDTTWRLAEPYEGAQEDLQAIRDALLALGRDAELNGLAFDTRGFERKDGVHLMEPCLEYQTENCSGIWGCDSSFTVGSRMAEMFLNPLVSDNQWRSNDQYVAGWEGAEFDDQATVPPWPFARAPYPSPGLVTADSLIPHTQAEHMWHDPLDVSDGTNGADEAYFRREFFVHNACRPLMAKSSISVDDDYEFFVNGDLVFENHDNGGADLVDDVRAILSDGDNLFGIHAVDNGWADPDDRLYERVTFDARVLRREGLLVISGSSDGGPSGRVRFYDATAGALVGDFAESCDPVDLAFGPDGRFYVANGVCETRNVIGRFDGPTGNLGVVHCPLDPQVGEHDYACPDGAYPAEVDPVFVLDPAADYVPQDLQTDRFTQGPGGLVFGPHHNLYVSDPVKCRVHRYAGPFWNHIASKQIPPAPVQIPNGSHLGVFINGGCDVLGEARAMAFGPDHNLYIVSANTDSIQRYAGPVQSDIAGDHLGAFVASGLGGLDHPKDIVFGPDGNLYVASFGTSSVLRYHGPSSATPGAVIDQFVALDYPPVSLAFGQDNDLYISGSGGVQRHDGQTGAFKYRFATVPDPGQMVFSAIPDPDLDLGDFNDSGCVDYADLVDYLLPAIHSGSVDVVFDLNGDGQLDVADARKLVLLFSRPRGLACE